MSSSLKTSLCEILQSVGYTFAKWVVDNKDSIAESTEDELLSEFMRLIDAPRVPTPTIGMSGLAPVLNAAAGFGQINTAAKAPVKRTRTVKDAPEPLWITIEDYLTRKENGDKICTFVCEKSADENKKGRVCAATVEDTSDPDPFNWKCTGCKSKKTGDIKKKLDKTKPSLISKGIPGFNVPPVPQVPGMGPMPVLGSKPPSLPNFASLPSLPLSIPETKAVTLPKMPEAEEEPLPASIEWLPVTGLPTYYTTNMPGFKKVLFRMKDGKMYSVGRINGDINESATSHLVQLNDKETNFVTGQMASTYSFEGTLKMELPSLPGLPSIPGLPGF